MTAIRRAGDLWTPPLIELLAADQVGVLRPPGAARPRAATGGRPG